MAEAALKAMMDTFLTQMKTEQQQQLQQMQQTLQQQLQQQSQQLQQQMQQQIQQQLSALHITAPAALPSTISADATAALTAHPNLPDADMLYARLLHLAFPLVLAEGDTDLLQQCYQQLVDRVNSPVSPVLRQRTASQDSRNSQSARGHVVYQGGRQLYVSKRGIHHDLSKPPPSFNVHRSNLSDLTERRRFRRGLPRCECSAVLADGEGDG